MFVLRPRHRSLRSGPGSGTASGGGGGSGQANLLGVDSAVVTGPIVYGVVPPFAGKSAAFSAGVLAKVRTDALTGKLVSLSTGQLTYNATSIKSAALLGKSATFATGTPIARPANNIALTGKLATVASGNFTNVVRTDALTGKAAAFTAGVISPPLYNVQASGSGNDITITATSAFDLSYPALFGVEYRDGSGGAPYVFARSAPGQVSSQSITIGAADGVVAGDVLSYRAYYNLDNNDPIATRVYGTPVGEILVPGVTSLTGKAVTTATGALKVVRADILVGSASAVAAFSAGTITFIPGGSSSVNLNGQPATFAKGAFKPTHTTTASGKSAQFKPNIPAGNQLALEGTPKHNNVTSGSSMTTSAFTTAVATQVYIACLSNAANGVASITGGGLTFTVRKQQQVGAGSNYLDLWSAPAASALSGVQFTINFTGAPETNFATSCVFAFSGNNTVTIFDQNAAVPSSASGADPGTISTDNANDAVIMVARMTSTASPTAGNIGASGATLIDGADYLLVEYRIVSATLSSANCTIGTGSGDANAWITDALMSA